MKKIMWIILAVCMGSQMAIADGEKIQTADLGVVGPGGEVIVYYRDGNNIVVRNCVGGKDYKARPTKRTECTGPENRIPVAAFKRTLESILFIADADSLKPLTKEEMAAYRSANPGKLDELKAREKELEAQLGNIQGFVDYLKSIKGVPDAKTKQDLADAEQALNKVRQDLTEPGKQGAAIQKVNALIKKLIDEKIGSSNLQFVFSGSDSDQAFYTMLQQYNAARPECGTDDILNGVRQRAPGEPEEDKREGATSAAWLTNIFISTAYGAALTIDARIKDCALIPGNTKKSPLSNVPWNLVARKRDPETGKYHEVWKDSKSGLVWGDALDSRYTHYKAVEMDKDNKKVVKETACGSDKEGKSANAEIGEKSFALPTKEEFAQAEKDGIRDIVPNINGRWFWSSSVLPDYSDNAFDFSGSSGYVYYYYRGDSGVSVRCVAR